MPPLPAFSPTFVDARPLSGLVRGRWAERGGASAYVRVTPVCMSLRPPLSQQEDSENESEKSYKHARRHTYTQRKRSKKDAGGKKNEQTTV